MAAHLVLSVESEEKLAVDWLQRRYEFDNAARDPALLQQALQLVTGKPVARIADLGSGTGNNAMFLAAYLPQGCQLTLVEQHDYLLQACRSRCANARHPLPQTTFVHQDLHQWLAAEQSVDLICNSALLDLMTREELADVVKRLQELDTPMYSTLTYTGVRFMPGDTSDRLFVGLFEKHMSRELDRGQPLGAGTITTLAVLCEAAGLQLFTAPSNWQVTAGDAGFLQMNLGFYQRGIEAVLTEKSDRDSYTQWLRTKQSQLRAGTLTLQVMHQDVLLVPGP